MWCSGGVKEKLKRATLSSLCIVVFAEAQSLFFSTLFLLHLIFNNLILLRGGFEVGVQPHSSHIIPFTFCGMVAPEEEPEAVREHLNDCA